MRGEPMFMPHPNLGDDVNGTSSSPKSREACSWKVCPQIPFYRFKLSTILIRRCFGRGRGTDLGTSGILSGPGAGDDCGIDLGWLHA